MLEDKSLSDEEWFRILYALQVIGMDATQEEIDDCVLQYEQREQTYEQFKKRWPDLQHENGYIHID
jgi:hypothetical protein